MANPDVGTLIQNFAELRAKGRRTDAYALLRPELAGGDLRVILEYARALIEDGDGLNAISILKKNETHRDNIHFALLAAVAAKLLSRQMKEWEDRAETQILEALEDDPHGDGRLHQLQHYIHLCMKCDVPYSPDIDTALRHHYPEAPREVGKRDVVEAVFLRHKAGLRPEPGENMVIPPAHLFRESDTIAWAPIVDQQTDLYVGGQTFAVYRDVRLYMLPYMYGLLEISEGNFAGEMIGGCNPYVDGIITTFGDHVVKNVSHPLLARYPEQALPGKWLLPFRLAGTYYFHFAAETLQTIYEAREAQGELPVILPESDGFFDRIPKPVHDTALEAIRADGQCFHFLRDGIYRLEEVTVPARMKYGRISYQRDIIRYLGLDGDESHVSGNEIIYIARRQGTIRAVANEPDIIARLAAHFPRFRHIYLEDLSLAMQIQAFRNAAVVVAPHGGGLTNMIFCRPGTAIVEFQLPDTPIMYWHFAVMHALKYLAYIPESYDEKTLNFTIQPDKLITAIDRVQGFMPLDTNSLSRW